MKSNWSRALCIGLYVVIPLSFESKLRAADPVIHVQWDGGGTPVLNVDYTVTTTGSASAAFPDVDLVTGRQHWRIWSVDTDNTNDIGDIRAAPFRSGTFGEVFFERVPFTAFTGESVHAIDEAARVLRPGGRIVIQTGRAAPVNEIVESLR